MPAALPAMWRALKRGYQAEPLLLASRSACRSWPRCLMHSIALLLKLLADGVLGGRSYLVQAAAVGLGVSAAATWFLRVYSTRVQRRFRDKVTIALEAHVARLQASVATIEHHERPEYLDRLGMLRNQVFVLDHMYMSLFSTCGWILRLGVTLALLMSIHPALALLALFALPTVLSATWRPGVERIAEERGGAASRLARHLFDLATTAPPGKEVRVTRIGGRLTRDRRAAWERYYGPIARARLESAAWHALGLGHLWRRLRGRACVCLGGPPSDARRCAAGRGRRCAPLGLHRRDGGRNRLLARHLARGIEAAGVARRLRRSSGGGCRRSRTREAAMKAYASSTSHSPIPAPTGLCLEDVNLHLEPGSVVAIVGENGAGKTTLVKLLCRLYQPTQGRILVDGQVLGRMPPDTWRQRVAGAFQDFFRFEFKALHTVGLGDVPRLDDAPAVATAVERAGAGDVVDQFAAGLETQLGPTWPGGVEISFGQWQKLALARGFMREAPLLLVLDEPTAALDAETEHALFERYAAAARGGRWHDEWARPATAASPSWFRTGSARCGWPTSSWCSTARAWSKPALTTSSWPGAASTPSCTQSRPRRTGRWVLQVIGPPVG